MHGITKHFLTFMSDSQFLLFWADLFEVISMVPQQIPLPKPLPDVETPNTWISFASSLPEHDVNFSGFGWWKHSAIGKSARSARCWQLRCGMLVVLCCLQAQHTAGCGCFLQALQQPGLSTVFSITTKHSPRG